MYFIVYAAFVRIKLMMMMMMMIAHSMGQVIQEAPLPRTARPTCLVGELYDISSEKICDA